LQNDKKSFFLWQMLCQESLFRPFFIFCLVRPMIDVTPFVAFQPGAFIFLNIFWVLKKGWERCSSVLSMA
jgi:hypothetical protein